MEEDINFNESIPVELVNKDSSLLLEKLEVEGRIFSSSSDDAINDCCSKYALNPIISRL